MLYFEDRNYSYRANKDDIKVDIETKEPRP